MGFLSKYRDLRLKESADYEDEVEFNFGRAFNQLGEMFFGGMLSLFVPNAAVFRIIDLCRTTLRTSS